MVNLQDQIDKLTKQNQDLTKQLGLTKDSMNRLSRASDNLNKSVGIGEHGIRGLNTELKSADNNLRALANQFITAIRPRNILEATRQFEHVTLTMTRESMGQTRAVSEAIEETLLKAANNTAFFGITIEDNLRFMKEMNEVMQTNTFLTSQQQENFLLLARNSGAASSEIASIARGFADIGVGTEQAIENISTMQKQARAYGINVGQFMKTVGNNMKYLSSFNFDNGVQGFSKMLAKAQALRIDVSNTFSLAERLMDPEVAIETAAGFQMLGGAVGDLADPFSLLHMAQTDIGGLQDSVLGMAESAVSFNKETGEFDIPVSQMYRLREAAKLTGQSYQQLAEDAIKSKQRTEKIRLLDDLGKYSDEEKDLIANLSEFDGGELKVRVPGFDEAVNVANLGQEELAKLQQIQEDAKLSDRDIAMRQLSTLEYMAGLREETALVGLNLGQGTRALDDFDEIVRSTNRAGSEAMKQVFSVDKMKQLGESFSDAFEKGFKDSNLNDEFADQINNVFTNLNTGIGTLMKTIPENIEDDNVFKSPELLNVFTNSLDAFGTKITELGNTNITKSADAIGLLSTNLGGLGITVDELNTQLGGETNQTIVRSEDTTLSRSEDIRNKSLETLENNAQNSPQTNQNIKRGEIDVNGNIVLSLANGQTIEPDVLQQILNKPEFSSKVLEIINGNNQY